MVMRLDGVYPALVGNGWRSRQRQMAPSRCWMESGALQRIE
jgi:hypothetical protein